MSAFLISLLAGSCVLVIAAGFLSGADQSVVRRARAMTAARASGGAAAASPVHIIRPDDKLLDKIAQRFLPRSALLRSRLEATGLQITLGRYGVACSTLFLLATAIFVSVGTSLAIALVLAVGVGIFLPHAFVGALAAKRSNKFLKVLPDAIGLIVRGLRAGLPVTETIAVVAREAADPVGEEFREVTEQVRLGRPLEEAMGAMAGRLRLPEFNFLVISMSVQRETGGNLAETLENLNQILRSRRQMQLKIKAMASQATASALIIGSLPFVMGMLMLVLSPDYLSVLFSDPLGQIMFAGGLVSLSTGTFVMRKMVRFEV